MKRNSTCRRPPPQAINSEKSPGEILTIDGYCRNELQILTPRWLLTTGLPNKLIAYQIGVSEATIKAHVSAVLRKLRVRSRAQAIALSSAFERNQNGKLAASYF